MVNPEAKIPHTPTANVRHMHIGLLWHSPNNSNLGVGALTLANISLLKQALETIGAVAKFTIICFHDDTPYYPQVANIDCYTIVKKDLFNPFMLRSKFQSCDLIVDIGGGDSFTDIYGLKRFVFLAGSKALVLTSGTPLVLAPQTIGPFRSKILKAISNWLIAGSRMTFLRDELSMEAIQNPRALAKIEPSTDVAFSLSSNPRKTQKTLPAVGVNVSGLLYGNSAQNKTDFKMKLNYTDFIDRLLEHFANRDDLELRLIPHVLGGNERAQSDVTVAQALARKWNLPEPPVFTDPEQAKSYIADLDFFTGSRMHACIAAVSSGVATVPVAYSRKFAGVFGALGYDQTVDGLVTDVDTAIQRVVAGFENRRELAAACTAATERAGVKLERYIAEVAGILKEC